MRVLLLGGTGFIGSRVSERLQASGAEVTLYSRGKTGEVPEGVAWVRAPDTPSMLDFSDELLRREHDAVIHMMAMGEQEGKALAAAFDGRAGRIVMVSSCDVYLAYGRFIKLEIGEPEPGPIKEDGPLRTVLHPYRAQAQTHDDLAWRYEKILAERAVLDRPQGAVVRLPKVYGPGGNQRLETMYGMAHQPDWRWTHGYVDNVAAAIALVATARSLPARVYNIGEEHTPTSAERLRALPPAEIPPVSGDFDFRQHLVFDSGAIRRDLGYAEHISYEEGIERTLASNAPAKQSGPA